MKGTAGAPFKSPWLYTFYRGTADQNWFSVVVLTWDSQCTQNFPASRFSLYVTFKSGIDTACKSYSLEGRHFVNGPNHCWNFMDSGSESATYDNTLFPPMDKCHDFFSRPWTSAIGFFSRTWISAIGFFSRTWMKDELFWFINELFLFSLQNGFWLICCSLYWRK